MFELLDYLLEVLAFALRDQILLQCFGGIYGNAIFPILTVFSEGTIVLKGKPNRVTPLVTSVAIWSSECMASLSLMVSHRLVGGGRCRHLEVD